MDYQARTPCRDGLQKGEPRRSKIVPSLARVPVTSPSRLEGHRALAAIESALEPHQGHHAGWNCQLEKHGAKGYSQ